MVIIKYILPSNLAKEKSLHLLLDAFESEDLFLLTPPCIVWKNLQIPHTV